MIPFNKPYLAGKESHYISQVMKEGHFSGNGSFTKKCQQFFEDKWGFKKCLLTTSCTDALEMTAMLLDIQEGDEVIVPSYTFVSSALAFVRQGAKIIFADSRSDQPNIDESKLEELITPKTKAIVAVHYAGFACDMDVIMQLAKKHDIYVVEDAAQAIDSYYKKRPLGTIGHLSTFSFHETKNIQCGEGGMLCINDERFKKRAEILWEKGTNRAEFFRGEVNKYGWVDVGSSFLPPEYAAAFLYSQLENLEEIQNRRKEIWFKYFEGLKTLHESEYITIPTIPNDSTVNGHMFYITCRNTEERSKLISYLKKENIHSVFHYLSLHKSPYYQNKYAGEDLLQSNRYEENLLRLPLFKELSNLEIDNIINKIINFYTRF